MGITVPGLMTERPITDLNTLLSELTLAQESVRHVRNRLTEPSELGREELNTLAPILGLYLLHTQQLIAAAWAIRHIPTGVAHTAVRKR